MLFCKLSSKTTISRSTSIWNSCVVSPHSLKPRTLGIGKQINVFNNTHQKLWFSSQKISNTNKHEEVGVEPPKDENADTIFGKIARKEIKASICYEDEVCLAFNDLNPQAPVHILLIPKTPISRLSVAKENHKELLGHLMLTVPKIAKQAGLDDGYRVVINDGKNAGQSV